MSDRKHFKHSVVAAYLGPQSRAPLVSAKPSLRSRSVMHCHNRLSALFSRLHSSTNGETVPQHLPFPAVTMGFYSCDHESNMDVVMFSLPSNS